MAAAILIFALSGLLVLFITCAFLNQTNRNLTTAITHAEYVMEEIKDTNFTNIQANINNGIWDWDSQGITDEGLTAITGESIDAAVSGTELLDVTVTVSWMERGSPVGTRSVALETLIAEQ